jgi:hypothetical protein
MARLIFPVNHNFRNIGKSILKKCPVLLGFMLVTILSCGDEYYLDDVDCSQCYAPKPTVGPIIITVSINSENQRIPVKVFKGKYSESFRTNYNSAVVIDTVSTTEYQVDVDVNEYYSVEAEYVADGQKTLVVDGDKFKIYKVSDSCDEVCWIYKGGIIDVSLKE